jgi:regulator of protease activity HflC (stomatin/prohibitin superfamily)
MNSYFFGIVAAIIAMFGYTISSAKLVSEGNQVLVERLGRYQKTLNPGLNFIVPGLDKIVLEASTREQVLDVPPQQVITQDNVSLKVDAVVFWQIVDLRSAFYSVEDIEESIETLVLTTLRSEIGQLPLDMTYSSRDAINRTLVKKLDDATESWGVKITRVEIKDLSPTKTILESLELERAAQSRKKATIAEAEGVATSLQKIAEILRSQPNSQKALEFLAAQLYIEANEKIGTSQNSKILFVNPAGHRELIKEMLAEDLGKDISGNGSTPKPSSLDDA